MGLIGSGLVAEAKYREFNGTIVDDVVEVEDNGSPPLLEDRAEMKLESEYNPSGAAPGYLSLALVEDCDMNVRKFAFVAAWARVR